MSVRNRKAHEKRLALGLPAHTRIPEVEGLETIYLGSIRQDIDQGAGPSQCLDYAPYDIVDLFWTSDNTVWYVFTCARGFVYQARFEHAITLPIDHPYRIAADLAIEMGMGRPGAGKFGVR